MFFDPFTFLLAFFAARNDTALPLLSSEISSKFPLVLECHRALEAGRFFTCPLKGWSAAVPSISFLV